MNDNPRTKRKSKRGVWNTVFLVLGVSLLVALVANLNPQEVLAKLLQIGIWFVPAFAAYVSTQFLSTMTWRLCLDRSQSRASYFDMLRVFWAGHALNAVTPGGSIGEVLKVTLLREKVENDALVASVISYNAINSMAAAAFSVLGAAICVLWLDVPRAATIPLLIGSSVVFVALVGVVAMVHRGSLSTLLRWLRRLPFKALRESDSLQERALNIDKTLAGLFATRPRDVLAASMSAMTVRVLQTVEIWCFLMPILSTQLNVELVALLTQVASNLTVWTTAFVPSQIGTLEGGHAAVFELAGLDPVSGVTTVIARRVRTVLGVLIGLVLGGKVALEVRAEALAKATESDSD